MKSRIMFLNRLRGVVACDELGYNPNVPKDDGEKLFAEADKLIKEVCEGKKDCNMSPVIRNTMIGVDALLGAEAGYEKEMTKIAKTLPVASWVNAPERRGFGMLFLAIVVGECGDLNNYPTVAKLWRRMACAPWAFGEKTLMGATWKAGKEGKLPALEWEKYGYSPRRRSISYLIGLGIVKQNFMKLPAGGDSKSVTGSRTAPAGTDNGEPEPGTVPGPYRRRYEEAKAKALVNRPEWAVCAVCKGSKRSPTGKKACDNCKGTGKVGKRIHLHGMLLATKRLLLDLWIEWTGKALMTPEEARQAASIWS